MTLDTYGHLFEDRLDEVGSAMDAARNAAQQRRGSLRAVPPVAPVLPQGADDRVDHDDPFGVPAGQYAHRNVHPQRDSNPCYRRERAGSWAARRWGPETRISIREPGSRTVFVAPGSLR